MAIRTELPDGCFHLQFIDGHEYWYDGYGEYHRDNGPAYISRDSLRYYHHGNLHRLDGPAIIYEDGQVQYFINGKIPKNILNMVIIPEVIDLETFPSAIEVSIYAGPYRVYRISDPDELTLAILRYG